MLNPIIIKIQSKVSVSFLESPQPFTLTGLCTRAILARESIYSLTLGIESAHRLNRPGDTQDVMSRPEPENDVRESGSTA